MIRFDVLTLGDYLDKKSTEITVRSFAGFYHAQTPKHQRVSTLHFVLSDTSSEARSNMEKTLAGYEIMECTKLYFGPSEETMDELYQLTSLLMLATEDSTGMTIPHALSKGIPVLCFERDGLQDFIDPSCGITIKSRSMEQSIQEFTSMLDILHHDPEVREVLSRGAINRYESYSRLGNSTSVLHRQFLNI
jgi:glycosyltransferase involved in cell wall biosynthesis